MLWCFSDWNAFFWQTAIFWTRVVRSRGTMSIITGACRSLLVLLCQSDRLHTPACINMILPFCGCSQKSAAQRTQRRGFEVETCGLESRRTTISPPPTPTILMARWESSNDYHENKCINRYGGLRFLSPSFHLLCLHLPGTFYFAPWS